MQKISILILSLLISGCDFLNQKDPFPATKLYVIDIQHAVCAEKSIEVTSDMRVVFTHIQDLALEACDGNPSFSKDEFLATKKWIERQIKTEPSRK